ncbi:hypothetical protein EVAR_80929_1 [Eumeta japonica]|uniref:Uncharacterized protein n=1 Tax=Eumeta variegata TaxID=151549 RepID=A0A4C1V0A1_EUMVA|nr:hypothetical protein EVAR_80929_1 [Eumeta japonica]
MPLYCSALSLARSAQAERDNESCFFNSFSVVSQYVRIESVPGENARIGDAPHRHVRPPPAARVAPVECRNGHGR